MFNILILKFLEFLLFTFSDFLWHQVSILKRHMLTQRFNEAVLIRNILQVFDPFFRFSNNTRFRFGVIGEIEVHLHI